MALPSVRRVAKRLPATLAMALLLLFAPSRASAKQETRTVLVLGADTSFRSAMRVALSPWSLDVVAADVGPPPATLPRASREAHGIAVRYRAAGVVWITTEGGEPALWAYDPATEQTVSRPLAASPPFDAPTAAAAALTVKTLLRASTVAPPEERLGAEARPAPVSAPAPAPSTVEAPSPAPAPIGEPAAQLELTGSARAVAGDVDTRVGLGGAVWLGAARRIGLGGAVRFGPGLGVDTARFRGRFDELTASPSARLRVPLSSAISVEPRVGGSVHVTRINGVTLPAGEGAREGRLDLSLDAGFALDVAISPVIRVGLDVEGAWLLRWQRYLVRDATVLELAPLQGSAGLRVVTGWP